MQRLEAAAEREHADKALRALPAIRAQSGRAGSAEINVQDSADAKASCESQVRRPKIETVFCGGVGAMNRPYGRFARPKFD